MLVADITRFESSSSDERLFVSLSMIALAGMIGTGLFLSSGKALSQAGPLGCVLSFTMVRP